MPLALNWADVQTNGMPGFLRALEQLQKYVNVLEARVAQQSALIPDPGWVGHFGAKLQAQGNEIGGLEARVTDLELVVSEELLASLALPAEAAAELRAGVAEVRESTTITVNGDGGRGETVISV